MNLRDLADQNVFRKIADAALAEKGVTLTHAELSLLHERYPDEFPDPSPGSGEGD